MVGEKWDNKMYKGLKIYREELDERGHWFMYFSDDDGYEWYIEIDTTDTVIAEEQSGGCSCSNCRNAG